MLRFFQKIQPIFFTGALRHAASWGVSESEDIILENPNFNPDHVPKGMSPKGVTVYCVHGTADRNSAFKLVANRLMEDLPDYVSSIKLVTFEHRGEGKGIETFAEQLCEKIIKNEDTDVVLLGHSRGGLVNALCVEDYLKKKGINTHAVVNIGAPFQGSYLAMPPLSWFSTSVKQMEKNSDFLQELRAKVRQSDTPYYYFSSTNDYIVRPADACIPEHVKRMVTLDRHGHLSLLSSHRLVAYIKKIIASVGRKEPDLSENNSNVGVNNEQDFSDVLFGKKKIVSPLEEICIKIDEAIRQLMERIHFYSADDKVNVLLKLMSALNDMLDGDRGELYPEAKTVDGFLSAFLEDETVGKGRKPIDILSDPLNPSVPFLMSPAKPISETFVKSLLSDYKNIPLPVKVNMTPQQLNDVQSQEKKTIQL